MKALTAIAVLIAVGCGLTGCHYNWNTGAFRGDATPLFNPGWGWSRYQMVFEPISATKRGSFAFTFSGAPEWQLWLEFGAEHDRAPTIIADAGTIIAVRLEIGSPEHPGRTVKGTYGRLSDDWTLGEPPPTYHKGFIVDFDPNETYTLYIDVWIEQDVGEDVMLKPLFRGGSDLG